MTTLPTGASPVPSRRSGLVVAVAMRPPGGRLREALDAVPATPPAGPAEPGTWECVPADGVATVATLRALQRYGVRDAGVGLGGLDRPPTRREGAAVPAPAQSAARVALGAAHRRRHGVAVRVSSPRGRYRPSPQAVDDAETCLWLLADLWHRRSPEGWEVADLMDTGLTGRQVARVLDISPSAVSQRATAARYVDGRRAADLAARLLDGLLRALDGTPA